MFVYMLSNWPLSFTSEETFSHATPFEVLCQRIPIRSLIHSDKHCCYRRYICDGVLCLRIFLLCTLLLTKELCHLVTLLLLQSQQRCTLCVRLQDILLLKGTKHQLSVYDKMQKLYRFCMPIFHFSSVAGPLQKDGLKNKINRMHKFAHTNK